jgi:uncharacterized membrane protein
MMYTVYYLIVGSLFSAIIDVNAHFKNTDRMNNIERFCVIALWPIGVVVFIYHLIKEFKG